MMGRVECREPDDLAALVERHLGGGRIDAARDTVDHAPVRTAGMDRRAVTGADPICG
jgi:hypothetical protein